MTFIAVTNITGVPAQVGVDLELTGTVAPTNATNKAIEWSVVSGSGSVSVKNGKPYLNASASGNVVVRATVRNGIKAT